MGKKPRSKCRPMNEEVLDNTEHTKYTSPRVFQRDKINFDFNCRSLQWTDKQKELLALLLN